MLASSVFSSPRTEVYILYELADGGRLQLAMGMGNAINGCIDVGISKGHIESDGVLVVCMGIRLGNDFGLVCTRPGFAPRDLTGLARLPTDCSG